MTPLWRCGTRRLRSSNTATHERQAEAAEQRARTLRGAAAPLVRDKVDLAVSESCRAAPRTWKPKRRPGYWSRLTST